MNPEVSEGGDGADSSAASTSWGGGGGPARITSWMLYNTNTELYISDFELRHSQAATWTQHTFNTSACQKVFIEKGISTDAWKIHAKSWD